MLRSMYSGISGMKVNQVKLDVTGNNIANVGTTAFKGSRVRFQDMLSQNVSEALGPGRNTGGVNPRQVGLGVQVAGIDTIVSQGMMQPTSRNLDAAMDGTGYFLVARGPLPESNAGGVGVDPAQHTMSGGNLEVSFTRDGSFTLDHAGNLLTSDGYRVMGYAINEKDANGKVIGDPSIDYNANGAVNFIDADAKNGLKASNTLVPLRIPDSVHVPAFKSIKDSTGTVIPTEMNFIGKGKIEEEDPTDSTKKISYVKNKPQITITSNDGKYLSKNDLNLEIRFIDNPKYDDAGKAWGTTTPTKGWRLFVNGEESGKPDGAIIIDKDGKKIDTAPADGSATQITFIAPEVDSTLVKNGEETKYSWSFNITAEGDKKIRSFSMEKDGIVKAVLDDGTVSALGQIAMASFKNPAGLSKLGKNMLQNTANSGQPIIRSGAGTDPAYDNGDGYGDVMQGMLEMSNIDLAEQFTDMIVTTRAFQAAGKMITTGDEILQDIINLKR